MRANELRIGNLILLNENTIISVSEMTVYNMIHRAESADYKPIPLTEEWLLRFGWGKGEFDSEYMDNVSLKEEALSYNVDAKMLIIETPYHNLEINHIKYVHQLQNLYFALTGNELTIKT